MNASTELPCRREASNGDPAQCSKRLLALIEASPLPIVSLDLDGRVVTWSRAAEKTFGWSEAEALGQVLPCLLDHSAEEIEALRHRVRSETAYRDYQVHRRHKDGSLVEVSISTAPIYDEAGSFTGMAVVYDDVTERNQTARALRASEDQLRHAQKMEAIGRLAGGVAHDFNNILTAIQSYAEILAEDLGAGHASLGDVQEIQAAAGRAGSLTRQLLAFSRKQSACLDVIDLNVTVRETERMLRRVIGEDVTLQAELAADLAPVQADANQMGQLLLNLAVNARDAMPNGGTLWITTRNVLVHGGSAARVPPGGYVCLTVRDTGTGMDAATQARIFEPFFTTKEAGKGTGLGLSMVYGFVQQCGGTIEVDSRVGEGSCFTIWLPQHTTLQAWHPEPEAAPLPASAGRTILLVEDDTMVRTIARRTLIRAGYKVLEASNARAAMDFAGLPGVSIDLVVADTVLPGMSGTVFAREFRRTHPHCPILMMSGYTEEAASRVVLRKTGDDFLDKPFSSHGLLQAVARALRPDPHGASSVA